MKRVTSILLFWLFGLVTLALAFEWVAGYHVSKGVTVFRPSRREPLLSLGLTGAHLHVSATWETAAGRAVPDPPPDPTFRRLTYGWERDAAPLDEVAALKELGPPLVHVWLDGLGFFVCRVDVGSEARPLILWVPDWFLILFTGGISALAGRRSSRTRLAQLRQKRGECPGCGYDLRGCVGRCPECGRAADFEAATSRNRE